MSDIQELIHKTSMDCIKQGERQATERIIKMLEERIANWRESDLHQQADLFDYAIALIKVEN